MGQGRKYNPKQECRRLAHDPSPIDSEPSDNSDGSRPGKTILIPEPAHQTDVHFIHSTQSNNPTTSY
jgi:hypothetical protein